MCMLSAGCAKAETNSINTENTDFHAVVVSDLHYSVNGKDIDTIVPGMQYIEEITDALIREVIDVHPDVFILTGDNTNGGKPEDEAALAQKLKQVEESGIPVVMTTGNHDYNQSGMEEYEKHFAFLKNPVEEDSHSQSYVEAVGNVILLAMDDGAVDSGQSGSFSKGTMQWLEKMLEKYDDHPMIFLSHHNVFSASGTRDKSGYTITNEDLIPLLESHGVKLVLSGHTHSSAIQKDDRMYEIVSSMPASGSHRLGFLTIENCAVEYHSEPIRFSVYGSEGLDDQMLQLDQKAGKQSQDTFTQILKEKNLSEEDTEGVLVLIEKFMNAFAEGTLGDTAEAIRNDPYYEKMIAALADCNYGPWMKAVMDNPPLPATHLSFFWK